MDSSNRESEFNQGLSFLNRMNAWYYVLGQSKINRDSSLWFDTLATIFTELSDDMNEVEIGECIRLLNETNTVIAETQNNASADDAIPGKLYYKLLTWEMYLRKVFNRLGYKTRYKDDPSFALQ